MFVHINRKNTMKKIITLTVALLSIIPIQSHAATLKSIAIIDTGYNSVFPHSNVVDEVCITNPNYPSCPNGSVFQEGAGSAQLTTSQLSLTNALHGTEMLAAADTTGNVPVVFIRIASFYNNTMYMPSVAQERAAFDWVYQNAAKFNIGAVSLSMGSLATNCYYDAQMATSVNNLKALGIPLIAAAGNNSFINQIAYPACMKPTIGIGGTDQYGLYALWSNYSSTLDFAAQGVMDVYINNVKYHEVGNSASTAIFAADWAIIKQNKPNLTYDQEYSLIKSTATLVSNVYVKNIPAINLAAALK